MQPLGVYGSIGTKYIKTYLELYFLIHIAMFIYMYVHFMCLFAPWTKGPELVVQKDFQKLSRVSQERVLYVENAGCYM